MYWLVGYLQKTCQGRGEIVPSSDLKCTLWGRWSRNWNRGWSDSLWLFVVQWGCKINFTISFNDWDSISRLWFNNINVVLFVVVGYHDVVPNREARKVPQSSFQPASQEAHIRWLKEFEVGSQANRLSSLKGEYKQDASPKYDWKVQPEHNDWWHFCNIVQFMHSLTRASMKRIKTGLCKPTQPLDLRYPENLSYGVGASRKCPWVKWHSSLSQCHLLATACFASSAQTNSIVVHPQVTKQQQQTARRVKIHKFTARKTTL